ncbi:FecR family protein [uncultured Kriegella sp.]|uniref:FecR family protein n=1 Tax=uncultured Kriegella sp. TaxID=1798910 RepID=UPI0030D7E74C|tara:strand:+ start:23566 stop:24474 length:909 start_codon:yes stop_codon:yes gene_type:complete
MQENYLAKWLNNELTEAELSEFKKSDTYASYQRIAEASSNLEAPDFDMESTFMAVKNKHILHKPKVIQLHPFKKFLHIAAAVAILITGSYFYLNTLEDTVITQYAESKEIRLPDNSKITLNADSELSYDSKNWNNKRSIKLNGEAFFKVAKGKRFTVATADGTVAVLGTQFNVENRKDFFEVTCFEGLVSIQFKGQETKLPAGNSFLVVNGAIIKSKVTDTRPSWMDNESTFKSIPLKYVLSEFERQHNITVETKNIDSDQLFTGTFSNTDTELAVQSISVPSRIKFKFEGNKVLFYAENTP